MDNVTRPIRALTCRAAGLPVGISAYVLMSGGLLLLGGRIADLLDRRRAFLTGIAAACCSAAR